MFRKDLLLVDYPPNLTIVGTYHFLSDDDRAHLTDLIEETDFVAVEWDWFRNRHLDYQFKSDSILDQLYMHLFSSMNKANLLTYAPFREWWNAEKDAEFCMRIAAETEKPYYMVDQPIYETIDNLLCMSPVQKAGHLLSFIPFVGSSRAKEILGDERETYMMKELLGYEPERKGLLVVGRTHAENYQKKLINSGNRSSK